MSFQISSLPKEQFQHLFELPADELFALRGIRMVADKKPGFPCRVSLTDAEPGEEVILVNYEHQAAPTPYRASHAVYVRANAGQAVLRAGEIPKMLRSRLLSLRGFDAQGMLVTADAMEGCHLEAAIESMLSNEPVAYMHLHFAKAGCYAARVDRV